MPERSEEMLWRVWRRALYHGGSNILRRRPQRLWSDRRRRQSLDTLATAAGHELPDGVDLAGRSRALYSHLVDRSTPERERVCLQRMARLERAIWSLLPMQRQVLYLRALEGLSASEVARRLFGGDVCQVYRHLHRARRALERALKEAIGEGDSAR